VPGSAVWRRIDAHWGPGGFVGYARRRCRLTTTEPPERPSPRARRVTAAIIVAEIIGFALLIAPPVPKERPRAPSVAVLAPSASAAASEPHDAGVPDAAASGPEALPYIELDGGTLLDRNQVLITNMQRALGLSVEQTEKVSSIFAGSDRIGQGNPKSSRHPLTRDECLARRAVAPHLANADARCGAPNMVPLYDPTAGETADSAKVCIDQFEFPDIACELPVVWARANEAQELCHALGKRLCDAHEWEGACAGALKSPESEYAFGERRIMMQYLHNKDRELVWAYGKEQNHALCATGSAKSKGCTAGGWNICGTNDYPAGSFPDCVSSLGVYDQHGNAAEHMNFPMKPEELGSRGGSGETEMKGSWFIFAHANAHEDDCHFRAPSWHVTRIDDKNSHRNYHLGFRCCRDLPGG